MTTHDQARAEDVLEDALNRFFPSDAPYRHETEVTIEDLVEVTALCRDEGLLDQLFFAAIDPAEALMHVAALHVEVAKGPLQVDGQLEVLKETWPLHVLQPAAATALGLIDPAAVHPAVQKLRESLPDRGFLCEIEPVPGG